MTAEVVKDHDVAFAQRRDLDVLDTGAEDAAIDRSVDDPRGGDCDMAQGGDEGHASAWCSDQLRIHASIQCPKGALPISRLPRAAQPRSGVMLVLPKPHQ